MAPAKKSASTGRKKITDTRSTEDKLMDAALDLAAIHRWRDLSIAQISDTADVPIGRALMTLPSRQHILGALMTRTDAAVLDSLEDDPLDGTAKDKLFDLLMRRFDQFEGRQAALKGIAADVIRDPVATLCASSRFVKSMALTLQAAGVSSEGCVGTVRAKGLAAVQARAFRVWVNDDDPGLSATMKELDKALTQAEGFAGALNFNTNPASKTPESTS